MAICTGARAIRDENECHAWLEETLLEQLAAVEHDRWAHWQRYLHDQCERLDDGSLRIPADLVRRWEIQIERRYAELSEVEKQSDRDQVQKYLPLIASALAER